MDFEDTGVYNPDALNALQEVQPLEFAVSSPIKRLDFIIGFLRKKKPEIILTYVEKLEETYRRSVTKSYIEKSDLNLKEILSNFPNLKEFPGLAENNLNLYLNLLEIEDDSNWIKDKISVPQKNFLKAFLGVKYYNVEGLAKAIEREEAIQLYKNYITEYIIDYYKDTEDNVEDLNALWERYFDNFEENESEHWLVIQSKPNEGKMIYRKEVCLWNEAMKEFPDKEFKYLACCYGDFQGAKRENKHFVLTMNHTIVKGDPYCSCIFHDTRINWDLTHPLKEFWDNIWPLQKWQK